MVPLASNEAERCLSALTRHGPLRAAVRVSGSDTQHSAPRRPGRALPPGLLCRAGLLGLTGRAADRPVHARHGDARTGPPRLSAAPPRAPHGQRVARSRLLVRSGRRAARLRRSPRPGLRPRSRPRYDTGQRGRASRHEAHRRPGPRARAVLLVGRLLRDPSRILRAVVDSRRSVLPTTREHPGPPSDPPGHGLVQGKCPVPRPGCWHRAQRPGGERAGGQHLGVHDDRPRPCLSRRQVHDVRPRHRRPFAHERTRGF